MKYYTRKEAAEKLNVTIGAIDNWCRKPLDKYYRVKDGHATIHVLTKNLKKMYRYNKKKYETLDDLLDQKIEELTIKDIVYYLKIKTSTARNMFRKQKLTPLKRNGKVLIPKEQVDNLIKEKKC